MSTSHTTGGTISATCTSPSAVALPASCHGSDSDADCPHTSTSCCNTSQRSVRSSNALRRFRVTSGRARRRRRGRRSRTPAPGPASLLVELSVDIREWIAAGTPLDDPVPTDPVTLLVFVPAHADMYWISDLDALQKAVFAACDGRSSGAEIADALATNDGERDHVLALLDAWVEATALVVS